MQVATWGRASLLPLTLLLIAFLLFKLMPLSNLSFSSSSAQAVEYAVPPLSDTAAWQLVAVSGIGGVTALRVNLGDGEDITSKIKNPPQIDPCQRGLVREKTGDDCRWVVEKIRENLVRILLVSGGKIVGYIEYTLEPLQNLSERYQCPGCQRIPWSASGSKMVWTEWMEVSSWMQRQGLGPQVFLAGEKILRQYIGPGANGVRMLAAPNGPASWAAQHIVPIVGSGSWSGNVGDGYFVVIYSLPK